jgi:hypothetical protein
MIPGMSPGLQFALALLVALPLILAQVAAILVSLRNGRKLDANTAVQKDIHTLVNSQMGQQKLATALAARALAIAQPNDKNREAADLAEKAYADHQTQQAIVDTRAKLTDLEKKGAA